MIKERAKERRRSPRAKGDFSVEIADQKSRIIADTINISTSGISCQIDRSIPLFREIGIRLQLPGVSKGIECSGIIVRCDRVPGKNRYNLAIFFEDLSSADKEYISSYVEKTLSGSAG